MSKALDGAFRKGKEAARAGLARNACPYRDHRTRNGQLTWARSFIREWRRGFSEGQKEAALEEGK